MRRGAVSRLSRRVIGWSVESDMNDEDVKDGRYWQKKEGLVALSQCRVELIYLSLLKQIITLASL